MHTRVVCIQSVLLCIILLAVVCITIHQLAEADVRIIFRILNYYFCLLYSTFISWVRVDDEDVDRSQRRGRGDRIYPGWGYPARPASDTRAVISSCARKQRRHDVHRPPGPSRPGRNGLPSGGSRRGHGPRRRHLRAFDPGQHWPDYRKLVRQVLRSV